MKEKFLRAVAEPLFKGPQTKFDLALALAVTPRFLEKEVAEGRLRAVIIGSRSIRFLPVDIEAWLNARATRPPEATLLEAANR
jgi:hypothetical protein